ncbi:hypothetical protein D6C92_09668 [Aureobasidium pullulans]|nr:hypothetical protein D6C92_09668 [Aureobasidium pullulans]
MSSVITRNHSCTRCQRRKIKCDGQNPCAACLKVDANCERNNKTPLNTRQRKRGPRSTSTSFQASIGFSSAQPPLHFTPRIESLVSPPQSNIDVVPQHDLGAVASEPFHVESVLFDQPSTRSSMHDWPQPVQIFQLWQTFIDNVNPMTNLLHIPTTQHLVLEATHRKYGELSKQSRAILSSVFLTAVESMTDEECLRTMVETRECLLKKFFAMTKTCLLDADVMEGANMHVLQALVLYLIAARQHSSPDKLWLVIGIAVRLAHRLGIHREKILQRMTVFTAEISRRLWWQIFLLNRHYTNLCEGIDDTDPALTLLFDTNRPHNLNDSDLHPDMTILPLERQGVTDMLFCSIRYEIGVFVRELSQNSNSQESKSVAIQRLQGQLEDKYARYCDGSVPLQRVSRCLIKTTGYRLSLRHCHPPPDSQDNVSAISKGQHFDTALLLLQTQHSSCASPVLDRYRWHTKLFYCFEALFPVLHALAFDSLSEEIAAEAWHQVSLAYSFNPELLTNKASGYYKDYHQNLKSLALKAWNRMSSSSEALPPSFILFLQSQQHHSSGYSQPVVSNTMLQQSIQTNLPNDSSFTGQQSEEHLGELGNDVQAWDYWLDLFNNEGLLGF